MQMLRSAPRQASALRLADPGELVFDGAEIAGTEGRAPRAESAADSSILEKTLAAQGKMTPG